MELDGCGGFPFAPGLFGHRQGRKEQKLVAFHICLLLLAILSAAGGSGEAAARHRQTAEELRLWCGHPVAFADTVPPLTGLLSVLLGQTCLAVRRVWAHIPRHRSTDYEVHDVVACCGVRSNLPQRSAVCLPHRTQAITPRLFHICRLWPNLRTQAGAVKHRTTRPGGLLVGPCPNQHGLSWRL